MGVSIRSVVVVAKGAAGSAFGLFCLDPLIAAAPIIVVRRIAPITAARTAAGLRDERGGSMYQPGGVSAMQVEGRDQSKRAVWPIRAISSAHSV
jgi:hypothetical protein